MLFICYNNCSFSFQCARVCLKTSSLLLIGPKLPEFGYLAGHTVKNFPLGCLEKASGVFSTMTEGLGEISYVIGWQNSYLK